MTAARRAPYRARLRWPHASALLVLTLAACGSSDGTSPAAPPGPTPRPSVAPAPSATPATVAAMQLAGPSFAPVPQVNDRGWILLPWQGPGPAPDLRIVRAPDAGPDAAPLPVRACIPDELGSHCAQAMAIGDADWFLGLGPVALEAGVVPAAAALGPGGAVVPLYPVGGPLPVTGAGLPRVGPGARYVWLRNVAVPPVTTGGTVRPVLWREPGTEPELLPSEGFADGPRPEDVDADGRIAGAGIDPELPAVWLPSADGFELVVLPLLPDGTRGGALGVDGGWLAGWSDDGSGVEHAVVWTADVSGWTVAALPPPAPDVRCLRAVAISAGRVAGVCTRDGGALSIVWGGGDAGQWQPDLRLAPLPDDDDAVVTALSNDLAVGRSGHDAGSVSDDAASVAWRLPPAAGR